MSKRAYSRLTLVTIAENRSSAWRSIRHTDEIDVVKLQLARIPTRAYFRRMLLRATGSVLALLRLGILLLAPVREHRRAA
jgi:hypothetical protein